MMGLELTDQLPFTTGVNTLSEFLYDINIHICICIYIYIYVYVYTYITSQVNIINLEYFILLLFKLHSVFTRHGER
jgi:hypothetical protein